MEAKRNAPPPPEIPSNYASHPNQNVLPQRINEKRSRSSFGDRREGDEHRRDSGAFRVAPCTLRSGNRSNGDERTIADINYGYLPSEMKR
jgi:hypothetical protein